MNLIILLAAASVFPGLLYAFLRWRSKEALAAAGQLDLSDDELSDLPDHIHLVRVDETARAVPEPLTRMAEQLSAEGFEDAGIFTIDGMPEVMVRLLAHRAQSMYCALWTHTAAGSWFEFSCGYPGGRKVTFTTLTGAGLDARPDHTMVRDPGARLLDLYVRACTQRPMGVFTPASVEQAVSDFENGYALWMTWRRAQSRNRVVGAA